MPIPPRVTPIGERMWHWRQGARVMGVLNITPDSFSGDGLANAPDPVAVALAQARQFVAAGADILDIGGYSTRPGHTDLPVNEEINRVAPVISALRDAVDVPLSIDTFRVEVAEAALDAGATWLNDVSGLRPPNQEKKRESGRKRTSPNPHSSLLTPYTGWAPWRLVAVFPLYSCTTQLRSVQSGRLGMRKATTRLHPAKRRTTWWPM